MVRSQFIKTAITFAAGTGIGYAANSKYHGQGSVSFQKLLKSTPTGGGKVISVKALSVVSSLTHNLKPRKVDTEGTMKY